MKPQPSFLPFLLNQDMIDTIAPNQSPFEDLIDNACAIVKRYMVQYRFFPGRR
jgi:hypothetical protein